MRLVHAILLGSAGAAGCHFSASQGPDSGSNGVDGAPDSPPASDDASPGFVPLHVPVAGRAPGTANLDLTMVVDTTALTIGGNTTLPPGVSFDSWPQSSGIELAVLHVANLTVPSGSTVQVIGSRALVVIAAGEIVIAGNLDARAHGSIPGPGGSLHDAGTGKGLRGTHVGSFSDSGGSGAGFAFAGGGGGRGSAVSCTESAPRVTAGGPYGDATVALLVGGSGGGTAFNTSCTSTPGGAGGGSVQLSAATRVTISGSVNVGGGGGGGGRAYDSVHCDMSAGSGGGSGGTLVLQAPVIDGSGLVAANGGAGGSSGGDPNGDDAVPTAHGIAGQDGQLGTVPAIPGADVGVWSEDGGAGGALTTPAASGADEETCDGNGGGGGGSVGRIVVASPAGAAASVISASPAAAAITY